MFSNAFSSFFLFLLFSFFREYGLVCIDYYGVILSSLYNASVLSPKGNTNRWLLILKDIFSCFNLCRKLFFCCFSPPMYTAIYFILFRCPFLKELFLYIQIVQSAALCIHVNLVLGFWKPILLFLGLWFNTRHFFLCPSKTVIVLLEHFFRIYIYIFAKLYIINKIKMSCLIDRKIAYPRCTRVLVWITTWTRWKQACVTVCSFGQGD